jgi:Flp pilus assembly protein TadG
MTRRVQESRTGRRDRGSTSLELAILTPVMILLLGFVVVVGRVTVANNTVTAVAGNAAREASLARSSGAAAATASSSARTALAAQAVRCEGGAAVAVDVSGFAAAGAGVPGQSVVVTVDCLVSFSDLGIPGLPGSRTLTERGVSPIDPNRSTGGAP